MERIKPNRDSEDRWERIEWQLDQIRAILTFVVVASVIAGVVLAVTAGTASS